MNPYEVSTLKKGLMILDILQEEGSLTLSEIMKRFSFNKSTTFRLLYTLELMGYVKKTNNLYGITDKIKKNFHPFNARLNWIFVPPLYQLSSEIGETVHIGILQGTDIITTQVVDGTHSTQSRYEVGKRTPAHISALGKVILAFLREHDLETIMKQLKLVPKTKNTFIDPHLLKEHLKVIRHQGYAIDNEETQLGLRCIAAPIMYRDEVIAAVSLSGPTVRLNKKLDKNISKRLIQYSKKISKIMRINEIEEDVF